MAKVFLLIVVAVGRTKEVDTVLRRLKGVMSVDTVTGPYDIIAVVEAETLDEIGNLVIEKINSVNGISRTVTCLAL